VKGPCKDCLSWRPAGDDPAPLLVLLRGDGETAESIFELWQPAAARRGIVVFDRACPRSEGCASGSWWKWNGDPSWLGQQVKTLGHHVGRPLRQERNDLLRELTLRRLGRRGRMRNGYRFLLSPGRRGGGTGQTGRTGRTGRRPHSFRIGLCLMFAGGPVDPSFRNAFTV
jgi:hypothetical protein